MTGDKDTSLLGLSDLRLLMDNYQNIVQMSTILLEQQKQVIDLQKNMLQKQDNISKQQYEVMNDIRTVVDKLDKCTISLVKSNESIQDMYKQINNSIIVRSEKAEDKIEQLRLDSAKEHSGIVNKIYIAWGGTAAAIVSLASLFIVVYNKYDVVKDIHKILIDFVSNFPG